MRITMVCAGGYSSSMLVGEMEKVIKEKNLDIKIRATSESKFYLYEEDTDVLLLGPQVCYLEKSMHNKYDSKGIRIMVVNSKDYGLMNGRKVLEDVCNAYGDNSK